MPAHKLIIGVSVIVAGLGLAACGSSGTGGVASMTSASSLSTSVSDGPTSSPTTSAAPSTTHSSPITTSQATETTAQGTETTALDGPCDGHPCIGDWTKEQAEGGTVVQCVDGTWSHAGGISGACSDHGGEASQPSSSGSGETTTVPTTTVPSTSTATAPTSDAGSLRPCDQNISADTETSCDFAANTFYEYWKATGGDPATGERSVDVWSPTTQQSYTQICTDDGSKVSCTHSNGDEVQFSVASVLAYTQQQADAYAASGSLGP